LRLTGTHDSHLYPPLRKKRGGAQGFQVPTLCCKERTLFPGYLFYLFAHPSGIFALDKLLHFATAVNCAVTLRFFFVETLKRPSV
jgi:hypothetical protein